MELSDREKNETALVFEKIDAPIEDWRNIPRLVARYVLTLQMKLGKVIDHLKIKSSEEDTASLRKFTEDQFKHADDLYVQLKRETLRKQADLDERDSLLRKYSERIDSDLADFKNYLY